MSISSKYFWIPLLGSLISLGIVGILLASIMIDRPIQAIDYNSGSNLNEVLPEFLDINLMIKFQDKSIKGNVIYTFKSQVDGLNRIMLDFKEMNIINVEDPTTKEDIKYRTYNLPLQGKIYPDNKILIIYPKKKLNAGEIFKANIFYITKNPDSISWMNKEQTEDGNSPMMYSSCETIHCRSLIPSMDTPSVKAPFNVSLTTDLQLMALASGIRIGDPSSAHPPFIYQQKIPVPIYLFAIAVGNFTYKKIAKSDRVGIFTEPNIMEMALHSFEDAGTYLNIIESKLIPYEWQIYNILVLPKSFPYGGMENPYLTFTTAVILTPDKSQSKVIAHEIVHSWFGNLLTCMTWEHMWLNEGFTKFGERYIERMIYGFDTYMASSLIGKGNLIETINQFGSNSSLTKLVQDLKGQNPDIASSKISYEKGYMSLYIMAQIIGEDNMWDLLRIYIDTYKFESVDSLMFKTVAYDFISKLPNGTQFNNLIDWDTMLFGTGMPPKAPSFETARIIDIENMDSNYINGQPGNKSLLQSLNSYEIEVFMDDLDEKTNSDPSTNTLVNIDNDGNFTLKLPYSFSKTKWLALNIKRRYDIIKTIIENYVTKVGRIYLLKPIYRALVKLDRNEAIRLYNEAKSFYHPVCREAIEAIIYGK